MSGQRGIPSFFSSSSSSNSVEDDLLSLLQEAQSGGNPELAARLLEARVLGQTGDGDPQAAIGQMLSRLGQIAGRTTTTASSRDTPPTNSNNSFNPTGSNLSSNASLPSTEISSNDTSSVCTENIFGFGVHSGRSLAESPMPVFRMKGYTSSNSSTPGVSSSSSSSPLQDYVQNVQNVQKLQTVNNAFHSSSPSSYQTPPMDDVDDEDLGEYGEIFRYVYFFNTIYNICYLYYNS